jgi:hypothetical protein
VNTPAINQWLAREHTRLESEERSLRTRHPARPDNDRWRAEVQGKLDVCILLMNVPITPARCEDVLAKLRMRPRRDIDAIHAEHYLQAASALTDECLRRLVRLDD